MVQRIRNQVSEELATLNWKIRLTIKPVGEHESETDDQPEIQEQRLVSGGDIIPDLPRIARHVPSMEIVTPSNGLKKNILAFPTAFCDKSRKLRRLHFRSLPQKAVSKEKTKARLARSDLSGCQPYPCL